MYLLELPGFRMLDLPEFDIRSEPYAVGMEGWEGGEKGETINQRLTVPL